jgi:hypothetical protein
MADDVYTVGVLIYALLTGTPFPSDTSKFLPSEDTPISGSREWLNENLIASLKGPCFDLIWLLTEPFPDDRLSPEQA